MDIVEFLTARYGEDEAVARAAADLPCCAPLGWRAADRWSHRPRGSMTRDDTGGRAITLLTPDYPASIDSGVDLIRAEDGGIPLAVADHIVTWDPARVLADIAAKRAIVEVCTVELRMGCSTAWSVLLRLAAPHTEHPDFDPAWRIDA